VLYRNEQILLIVIPIPAWWLLPLELIFAFVAFLRTHDLAGFLGICTGIFVAWTLLTRRGLLGAGREAWLRTQGWWLRRRMDRLRRKRGFHVVGDRKDPWLH